MIVGAGLPVALAPVAEVLSLAQGFVLCIITGPRDHRDSVYIRLVETLADDFELVRHRLDRDGLEFFDVLTGGDGSRARVVFMSGLEAMSDEARKDAVVRLNLLRDSWAPHPARVILWLPAWGLGEFRKLAPDLFHWRSCLVPLHDADLPVRSEAEYLVWACERYRSGDGRDDPGHEQVAAFEHLLTDHRAVHLHYETAERVHLLRAMTGALARRRLEVLSAVSMDLDVLRPGSPSRRPEGLARTPVLLDAADMAGRVAVPLTWPSVARAAGIPIAAPAGDFWTAPGEQAALVVLLDGFDRLDLTPGGSAERLFTWLDTDNPGIQIAAFITAQEAPSVFARWVKHERPPLARHNAADPLTLDGPLVMLIMRIVLPAELRAFARYFFGDQIADQMPLDAPPAESLTALLELLKRSGMIDASFFEQLKELRPRLAIEIDAVAQRYLARA